MHDKRGYFGQKRTLQICKKKVLVAKDELNCIVILPKLCEVLKDKGLFEETSGTLLAPSSPREAIGNDPYWFCCWPTNKSELYNSAYHAWLFIEDVYVCSSEFYYRLTCSSSFLPACGSPPWTTLTHHQWPRYKIYWKGLESTDETDEDRPKLQHCFPPIVRWISRNKQLHIRAVITTVLLQRKMDRSVSHVSLTL